ncbi:MAG: two-CW domain-containing protein [Desulfobulbaceae bacterium]|jgi:hypothetical protein
MTALQNCWEYHQCGKGPDIEEANSCPAAREKRLHGVHGGVNGGRSCWVVAGTQCRGKTQGIFVQKYSTCQECNFYRKVLKENFNNFQVSVTLLQRLREPAGP